MPVEASKLPFFLVDGASLFAGKPLGFDVPGHLSQKKNDLAMDISPRLVARAADRRRVISLTIASVNGFG